ncbi:MAG TPA: sugar ABC transporter permease [Aggregatilinea sp.]|jgi:multiple sugar transport system permease protein|uniref:carbohydrate ABC transporter permease n=1 Tax=Aggregatilinea sp. TaxID=2806333 RepID=UPI002C4C154B|nr:sugar ABC transporter permease [Aggregatilinea sp.]HML20938.1 sugar ABC transporter permease [Aggregatilinea sp.]
MSGSKARSQPKSFILPELLNRLSNNEALIGYLFILPSLIGFTIFFAYPAIRAVYISFLDWNLLTDAKYVGLDNYRTLFSDKRFSDSLQVTVLYVLWNIPLQTALAIFMAVMLERFSTTVSSIIRGIMILPWLMPNVVVALLWLWILDPSIGLMNEFLKVVGIGKQPFMGSPSEAIQSIAGINIWRHVGYTSILIFAGLKTIPKSLYEAAAIDGAGELTQFRKITMPLLRPVLVFVLVTSVVGSFQVFDTVAVTTEGGPAGSTRVIIYYIYQQVFERQIKMGLATAASVVLFSILITVTIVQMRLLRAGESDLADYQ